MEAWRGARSGVLVVRAWMEGETADSLRARVTASAGHGQADQPVATAATVDDVANAVRSWLQGFVASGRPEFWEAFEERQR